MAPKEIPPEWMKRLKQGLLEANLLPAFEEEFPFPWQEAGVAIGRALQIDDLQISLVQKNYKEPSELLHGMGDKVSLSGIELSPTDGTFFLALADRTVSDLVLQTMTTTPMREGFSGSKLKEGFYTFILLKVLDALDSLHLFKNGSLRLSSLATLPEEKALCLDIAISLPNKNFQARLIFPQTFIDAFKATGPFQQETLHSLNVDVTLRGEVGHTKLADEELHVGDFIVLDKCSYDVSENKGSVTLKVGKTPFVLARLKTEGVKILDLAAMPEEEGTLIAEIDPIQLPFQTLLNLKPDTMLDFNLHPEQGVTLYKGDQMIGKGELLKLGETLGVRLLSDG
jgi:flagellar motor switch protein FliM/N